MKKLLKFLDDHFEECFLVVDFSLMIVVITLQVFCRKVLNSSLIWSEELARYLFIWQIFFGASLAIRDDSHMKVDIIYTLLPRLKKQIKVLAYCLFLAFACFMFVEGGKLAMSILFVKRQLSPAMHIPMGIVYCILPIGTFLMSLRLIQKIVATIKGEKGGNSNA